MPGSVSVSLRSLPSPLPLLFLGWDLGVISTMVQTGTHFPFYKPSWKPDPYLQHSSARREMGGAGVLEAVAEVQWPALAAFVSKVRSAPASMPRVACVMWARHIDGWKRDQRRGRFSAEPGASRTNAETSPPARAVNLFRTTREAQTIDR